LDNGERKLKLNEEPHNEVHEATISDVELGKNMAKLIHPQTHHAFGLWCVLKTRMRLVNWDVSFL